MTTDDAGGAYVAWTDDRGADYNIYAQHLDGTGDRQWASVGLLVCDATGTQYSARVVPDAAGGVFCCWMDRRDHFEGRVTGQHLDASGNALWIVNGRGLTWITLDISNRFRTMIPDQQGGFFLVVDEEVYENYEYLYDSYIYRIDADGDHVFTSSGLEIAPSLGHNGYASLVADGDGGVFAAAGYEGDNYYDREVRIQHFDGNGNDVWGHDGLTVSDPADRQTLPYLGPDGAGGIVVTWSDERTGYPAVYAQRLNASGLNLWPDEGVPVSGTAYLDRLTPVPAGGGWVKTLEATFSDIHLQRLGPYGYLDDPRPFITSVQDVPNDQGGEVTVTWDASRLDAIADHLVSEYSVWMRESEAKGAPLSDGEAADLAERKGWPIEEVAAFNKAGWGYVTQVPALLEPDYFAFAPTFGDSTAAGIAYTEYRVVAHSDAAWISWECLSALGYSVDNLEPGAPQALMALRQPDGTVDLTWSASGVNDEDLAYYLVYGAATPGFDLDETTYLGVTAATTFDHDPGDEIHYYRVTARDAHGNESAGSNEAEATALSATPDIVTITALHANRPNPFNPATVIAFDLPRAAHAELSIYAIDGSKVCTLVNGWQAPGRHEVRWNGRNEQDLGVAAGVYVYRLRGR